MLVSKETYMDYVVGTDNRTQVETILDVFPCPYHYFSGIDAEEYKFFYQILYPHLHIEVSCYRERTP